MSQKSHGKRRRHGNSASRPLEPSMSEETIRAIIEKEGYPALEECEAILQRRGEIMREMIEDLFVNSGSNQVARVQMFVANYGLRDTLAVMNSLERGFSRPDSFSEDAWLYRQYRLSYARFGNGRPFYTRREHQAATNEWSELTAKREMMPLKLRLSRRERELQDHLLAPPAMWEDLLPPAPPPRPADFSAPQPQEYHGPERELLEWGPDLNAARSHQATRWQGALVDLARMVLDEGLLAGWPGEPSSWAPYHALRLLGALRAAEFAAPLVALARRADDWLSDCLPDAWAEMGENAMPALWAILDNQDEAPEPRALAASALQKITKAKPGLRSVIVKGLADGLSAPSSTSATLNAYLILILRDMDADEAGPAIHAAFERGAVNRRIVEPKE